MFYVNSRSRLDCFALAAAPPITKQPTTPDLKIFIHGISICKCPTINHSMHHHHLTTLIFIVMYCLLSFVMEVEQILYLAITQSLEERDLLGQQTNIIISMFVLTLSLSLSYQKFLDCSYHPWHSQLCMAYTTQGLIYFELRLDVFSIGFRFRFRICSCIAFKIRLQLQQQQMV